MAQLGVKRSASSMLAQLNESRKTKTQTVERIIQTEWEPVSLKDFTYKVHEVGEVEHYATLKRMEEPSLVKIFSSIVTGTLLEDIWDSKDRGHWAYSNNTYTNILFKGKFTLHMILKWLAIQIRIIGLQDAPTEGSGVRSPLRTSLDENRQYFKQKLSTQELEC